MKNKAISDKLDLMFDACVSVINIGDQHIVFEQHTCWSGGAAGQVKLDQDYLTREIRIDPQVHSSDEEMFDTVLHEVVHVAMSPCDTYRRVTQKFIPKESRKAMRRLYTTCDEQVVVRFTRALYPAAWARYQALLKQSKKKKEKKA